MNVSRVGAPIFPHRSYGVGETPNGFAMAMIGIYRNDHREYLSRPSHESSDSSQSGGSRSSSPEGFTYEQAMARSAMRANNPAPSVEKKESLLHLVARCLIPCMKSKS